MLQRAILARCDTKERREAISSARKLLYEGQYVIDTPRVEAILKPESLVPTMVCVLSCTDISYNSCPEWVFSKAWSYKFWFLPYAGCWPVARVWTRGLEIHFYPLTSYTWQPQGYGTCRTWSPVSGLSCSWRLINQPDCGERFRQVPSFGRDTIRRFQKNVSGLKRLVARDFEDILQVSISFPEPFCCCLSYSTWSMHSVRLQFLRGCCQILKMRRFCTCCSYYAIGTVLPSYACTPMKHSIFLRKWQRIFVIASAALLQTLVRILRPRS